MQTANKQVAREEHGLFSFRSLRQLWKHSLDLIFPPRCQHCGRVDTHFCDVCLQDLRSVPIDALVDRLDPMQGVLSTGTHSSLLQSAVQALKYNGQRQLAEPLADRISTAIAGQDWRIDTVIPVPLHTNRLKKRGYNQAKELSTHLAQLLSVPHNDTWLVRHTQTQSQVGLTRAERIDNVKENFYVTHDQLTGINVLLVDDVRTTGATLAECARILRENGATSIYAVTVTIAERPN